MLLKTKVEAAISGHDAINEVENETDAFMIAVWGIKDGKLRLVNRTTWKFPLGDVRAAIGQLEENLRGETVELPPLPQADLSFVKAPEVWSQ